MDQLKPYRFVLALAALLCVALPTVPLGARLPQSAAAPAGPPSRTTTFTDSTRDTKRADIQTLFVANNDAGAITCRICVPNHPQVGLTRIPLLISAGPL